MNKTDGWIIVGILTVALIIAAGIYFGTRGPQDQNTAANQELTSSREARAPAPQNNTAPPPNPPKQSQTTDTHLTIENTPSPPRQPKTAATQEATKSRQSGGLQQPFNQAGESASFSGQEKRSRATQSRSHSTVQSKLKPGGGVVQPPSSPPSAVVPPASSGEPPLQTLDSNPVATHDNPGAASAALQPPASSPSATVEPVVAPFAMLRATGKMLLDGKLSDDTVIFSGESIETPPDTYATLVRGQSEVLIKPNSRLTLTEKALELERGEVLVTTPNGLPVEANRLTITPDSNGPAKYEVLNTSESPQVKTYEGSVLVKD